MSIDWTWLIIGAIVGWLGQWFLVDYPFYRRKGDEGTAPTASLSGDGQKVKDLEGQLGAMKLQLSDAHAKLEASAAKPVAPVVDAGEDWKSKYEALTKELSAVRIELSNAKRANDSCEVNLRQSLDEITRMRASMKAAAAASVVPGAANLADPAPVPPSYKDPLEKIDGIGPVYEAKLWGAGILTFLQLSQSTPERVLEIIKPEEWQKLDVVAWIAEAGQFARGEKK